MSDLIHLKGDLFKFADAGYFDAIVHGCNAQGVMGSGIAKQVKAKYPECFRLYQTGTLRPGYYTMYPTGKFSIVNAITQDHYLPRGRDHFDYEGFRRIVYSLSRSFPGWRWGFPYIGMGLAGGDSRLILYTLENLATRVKEQGGSVTLVEYDG